MAYTTINKSTDYFNTKLYTGNGSTQSITGLDFQPDLNWTKQRNVSQDHTLTDSIRGVGKLLFSSDAAAENTDVNSLTSFNSDGFSVGTSGYMNTNSNTYASWNWLGANGTAANTDGSISSTVSANTTSGFSIVSFTGTGANATVGHGLNVAPKMIHIKNRTTARGWISGHESIGWTKNLYLDGTNAEDTRSDTFNNTSPTSSVFSIGSSVGVNQNTDSMIAYCFSEVKGYSKFGSYTGNGSADGAFVYTGFKPAFVLVKDTSSSNNWRLSDNKRNEFNLVDDFLFPSSNIAENATSGSFDFLSNGFKARSSNGGMNASGSTYIYMAFASAPLVGSNNVPCTAR